jgi:probable HAF family extracellular repeat protein
MSDLGTLGGSQSNAHAINASGRVVGGANTAGNAEYHAFVLASPELDACDRNYDQRITISDALVALQAAVSPCLKAGYCDADGDGSESVTDALAILQYAVALPVTLECTCIAIDECFDDGDCAPGLFCQPYRCVECEFDTDCADGFVCDRCTYKCHEAPGAVASMSLR